MSAIKAEINKSMHKELEARSAAATARDYIHADLQHFKATGQKADLGAITGEDLAVHFPRFPEGIDDEPAHITSMNKIIFPRHVELGRDVSNDGSDLNTALLRMSVGKVVIHLISGDGLGKVICTIISIRDLFKADLFQVDAFSKHFDATRLIHTDNLAAAAELPTKMVDCESV